MPEINFNELLQNFLDKTNIKRVDKRNYWLVRTNSGNNYNDFVLHNYVAIGWDYITLDMLNTKSQEDIKKIIEFHLKSNENNSLETDDEIDEDEEDDDDIEDGRIKDKSTKRNRKITSIVNKITSFVNDIKFGDVVLIPSKNSEKISIGIVNSNVYEDNNYIEKYLAEDPNTELSLCSYSKRRNINWIKHATRSTLDIYLIKLFNAHQAIFSANEYTPYINRMIYPIYIQDNEVHATIHAGHPKGVSLKEMTNFIDFLNSSLQTISETFGEELDTNCIDLKINIHSPGLIEIATAGAIGIFTISALIFAINQYINGGEVNFGLKLSNGTQFGLFSKSEGTKGRQIQEKEVELKKAELNLKEKEQLLKLTKNLDLEFPTLEVVPENVSEDIPKNDN